MKYLFDNDISFRFAAMLRALGVDAHALRDLYPQNVKDVDFLGDMHQTHGIEAFVSHNTSQRTHPVESILLKGSGVTCLYLSPFWCKLSFWQQAKWLISHWEKIDGFAKGVVAGTCADIKQNGRAELYKL